MTYFESTTSADSAPVRLEYVDYGEGSPVVLVHGWPLSYRMWEDQFEALVGAGHRVIAYTRRGFGGSDKPWNGYDYDTLTEDLRNLVVGLDLQDAALVGFSMGGGEVARYFGNHGSDRVSKAALVSAVTPLMYQADDNPQGVPEETLNGMMEAMTADRPKFLASFGLDFFSVDSKDNDVVSAEFIDYLHTIANFASGRATRECAKAFGGTDWRPDMPKIDVPTLVVHGTADQVVPIETAGDQAAEMIANSRYEKIEGAPHALNHSHKDQFNEILLDFLS